EEIDRGTEPLFAAYRRELDGRLAARFGIEPSEIRPWHMADPFFQEAPAGEVNLDPWYSGRSLEELTERFFAAIGFDVRPVAARRAIRAQLLVQTRWELVMCAMERELYRDPAQDLDARWWDLVERYQWVKRPEDRRGPDWASKIHFSVAPVYYQNYLLGEIMA